MVATQHRYDDATVQSLATQFARRRDSELKEALVAQLSPLVRSIARKFAGSEPVEDLESEGFLGLLQAIEQYDPSRGAKFSTYATHLVGGHIRHYLRDRGHMIRQPAWVQELSQKLQRTVATLEQELHREPTSLEIAERMNLTEDAVDEILSHRSAAQVLRMDGAAGGDEDELGFVDMDKIKSLKYVTLELPVEDRIVLEETLSRLKDMERKVLYNFFFQEYNQSEIARSLGISCNYVGYLLRNGLKHLRERMQPGMDREEALLVPSAESLLDAATGLYSRAYFEQRLREELSRSQRRQQSVGLCCFHLPERTPERAIRDVASVLRAELRRADIPARMESTELGVILVDTGAASRDVAHRLAHTIHKATHLEISAGAAFFPSSGQSPTELYNTARLAAVGPVPVL